MIYIQRSDGTKASYEGMDEAGIMSALSSMGHTGVVIDKATYDTPPARTPAQIDAAKLRAIRAERDRRIAATDYMAMPDYPNKPVGLDAYRQSLRDFTNQYKANPALLAGLDVSTLAWPPTPA